MHSELFFRNERDIDEIRVAVFCDLISNGKSLEAILVRKMPNGTYDIIDGVQRIEACRRLNIENIGAYVVSDCDDHLAEQLRAEVNTATRVHNLN
jgi:hypothetical protein